MVFQHLEDASHIASSGLAPHPLCTAGLLEWIVRNSFEWFKIPVYFCFFFIIYFLFKNDFLIKYSFKIIFKRWWDRFYLTWYSLWSTENVSHTIPRTPLLTTYTLLHVPITYIKKEITHTHTHPHPHQHPHPHPPPPTHTHTHTPTCTSHTMNQTKPTKYT